MGRIKTKLSKAYARDLMKHEGFGTDFEVNKQKIQAIAQPQSKKIRNIVAGYITRLKKAEE